MVLGSFIHETSHLTQCQRVPIVGPSFCNMALFITMGITKLFKLFSRLMSKVPHIPFWPFFLYLQLDLRFQFWTPWSIPFESSSTSFVCAHPFDFEVGGVVILLCSPRPFGLRFIQCGCLAFIFVFLAMVFFHPPSTIHKETNLRIWQFLTRDWENFHVQHVFGFEHLWWPFIQFKPPWLTLPF